MYKFKLFSKCYITSSRFSQFGFALLHFLTCKQLSKLNKNLERSMFAHWTVLQDLVIFSCYYMQLRYIFTAGMHIRMLALLQSIISVPSTALVLIYKLASKCCFSDRILNKCGEEGKRFILIPSEYSIRILTTSNCKWLCCY